MPGTLEGSRDMMNNVVLYSIAIAFITDPHVQKKVQNFDEGSASVEQHHPPRTPPKYNVDQIDFF